MGQAVPEERLYSKRLKILGGVEIGRYRFRPGETVFPALPGHLVNLHLGAPTQAATRRADASWEGTQRAGNVEVLAAGRATEQVLLSTSEDASVLLGDEFFRRVANETGVEGNSFEVIDHLEGYDPTIERIILSLLAELETDSLGGELYAQSLATALAVHLLRQHSSLGNGSRRRFGIKPTGRLSERTLRLIAVHIDDNLCGEISLNEMAAVATVSTRHFLRLFKLSTGLSPHQYVIRRRVEMARMLLSAGDLPLGMVALACGFSHQQHLSRHFKRLVGVSPRHYRVMSSR